LPELVTYGLDDYVAAARALARNPERLRELRHRLDQRRRPALQTNLYRRRLESAYHAIWERHTRGESAADIELRSWKALSSGGRSA
jgi:protein O-GlcNAc transferase